MTITTKNPFSPIPHDQQARINQLLAMQKKTREGQQTTNKPDKEASRTSQTTLAQAESA